MQNKLDAQKGCYNLVKKSAACAATKEDYMFEGTKFLRFTNIKFLDSWKFASLRLINSEIAILKAENQEVTYRLRFFDSHPFYRDESVEKFESADQHQDGWIENRRPRHLDVIKVVCELECSENCEARFPDIVCGIKIVFNDLDRELNSNSLTMFWKKEDVIYALGSSGHFGDLVIKTFKNKIETYSDYIVLQSEYFTAEAPRTIINPQNNNTVEIVEFLKKDDPTDVLVYSYFEKTGKVIIKEICLEICPECAMQCLEKGNFTNGPLICKHPKSAGLSLRFIDHNKKLDFTFENRKIYLEASVIDGGISNIEMYCEDRKVNKNALEILETLGIEEVLYSESTPIITSMSEQS